MSLTSKVEDGPKEGGRWGKVTSALQQMCQVWLDWQGEVLAAGAQGPACSLWFSATPIWKLYCILDPFISSSRYCGWCKAALEQHSSSLHCVQFCVRDVVAHNGSLCMSLSARDSWVLLQVRNTQTSQWNVNCSGSLCWTIYNAAANDCIAAGRGQQRRLFPLPSPTQQRRNGGRLQFALLSTSRWARKTWPSGPSQFYLRYKVLTGSLCALGFH